MSDLGTMVANVARNLGDPNLQFYTEEELKQYIGEGFKKYSIIMIEEADGFFETTVNVGFTANDPGISVDSLDPPFYTISQFERWLSNGSSMPLKLNERRFKINNNIAITSGDAYRPTYKQRGMKIILEPTPSATEAPSPTGQATTGMKLDYNYIPEYPDADSDDSFEFDSCFPTNWEFGVELFATVRALEGKDAVGGVSDTNTFRQTLAEWEQNFEDSLQRDENPESVEQMGMDYSTNLFSGGFF